MLLYHPNLVPCSLSLLEQHHQYQYHRQNILILDKYHHHLNLPHLPNPDLHLHPSVLLSLIDLIYKILGKQLGHLSLQWGLLLKLLHYLVFHQLIHLHHCQYHHMLTQGSLDRQIPLRQLVYRQNQFRLYPKSRTYQFLYQNIRGHLIHHLRFHYQPNNQRQHLVDHDQKYLQ